MMFIGACVFMVFIFAKGYKAYKKSTKGFNFADRASEASNYLKNMGPRKAPDDELLSEDSNAQFTRNKNIFKMKGNSNRRSSTAIVQDSDFISFNVSLSPSTTSRRQALLLPTWIKAAAQRARKRNSTAATKLQRSRAGQTRTLSVRKPRSRRNKTMKKRSKRRCETH